MAETLSLLSTIAFILAAAGAAGAIFFWFYYKIPTVIGDLTGRTARKSIAQMRSMNEEKSAKGHKESAVNLKRGKLTDAIAVSGKLKKEKAKTASGMLNKEKTNASSIENPETGLLTDNRAEDVCVEETAMLADETISLDETQATELLVDEEETTPLEVPVPEYAVNKIAGRKFTVLDEVILIHTDETID